MTTLVSITILLPKLRLQYVKYCQHYRTLFLELYLMFLLYSNTVHFIDRIVKGKLIQLSPATKRMFCNLDCFVFAHTGKISNCCCKNLKLISKIHELKTTAIWNRAARVIIFEFKEFPSSGNTRV